MLFALVNERLLPGMVQLEARELFVQFTFELDLLLNQTGLIILVDRPLFLGDRLVQFFFLAAELLA